MVLIDDVGDQVWLSGPSSQPGGITAARQIVRRLGLAADVLEGESGRQEEIHLVDGTIVVAQADRKARAATCGGELAVS